MSIEILIFPSTFLFTEVCRLAADLYMVLGALLGTQNGREVEIVNTFELAVEDGREIMAFSYKDGINILTYRCSLREVGVGAIGQYWTFLDLANTVALMVNPSPYYRVKRPDRRNSVDQAVLRGAFNANLAKIKILSSPSFSRTMTREAPAPIP
ncbi:hypothetical protein EV363DRAFT_1585079 [Boletus edulis]|nr:hypothetical protein EV363DRAFT_1585079 [Boletus edulis]